MDDDLPSAAQLGALDRWSFVRRVVVSERDPERLSKPSGPGPQHQPLPSVPPAYIRRDGTKMLSKEVAKPALPPVRPPVPVQGSTVRRHTGIGFGTEPRTIMLNPGVPPHKGASPAPRPVSPLAHRRRALEQLWSHDPFGIPRADGGAGARRVRSRWKPPADKITVAELRQTASLPALPSAGAMAQSGAWKKAKTNSKLVIAAKTAAHQARAARRAAAHQRKATSGPLRGISLESGGDRSIQEQLRDALVAHAVRVIDLFKEWDKNGDGRISKREFRRAMPALGLSAPPAAIDALFDTFDWDSTGDIGFRELNKLLRRDVKQEKRAVHLEEAVALVDPSELRQKYEAQFREQLLDDETEFFIERARERRAHSVVTRSVLEAPTPKPLPPLAHAPAVSATAAKPESYSVALGKPAS